MPDNDPGKVNESDGEKRNQDSTQLCHEPAEGWERHDTAHAQDIHIKLQQPREVQDELDGVFPIDGQEAEDAHLLQGGDHHTAHHANKSHGLGLGCMVFIVDHVIYDAQNDK